ncbi:MAG: hypothetical protein M0D57_05140 [Sphingobacteriales bacterium JAD_PAG50586_3]|nr:MAG: hypothetical protein M0D57_05140 [Sphingobacteriales bacterium JAD_PAG50586_3]
MRFIDEWEFQIHTSRRHVNLDRISGLVDKFHPPSQKVKPELNYEAVELLFYGDLHYHEAKEFLRKQTFFDVDPEAIKHVQQLLETSNINVMVSGLKNRQQFKEFAEYLFYKSI